MKTKIAFGTYRISLHNEQHIAALKFALNSGVELIDTATTYMDTLSESAVGIALNSLEKGKKERVAVVSKFGLISGSIFQEIENKTYEDIVEYSDEFHYCISAEFMRDQLSNSLSRLSLDNLDCYMLHNPEIYLQHALANNIPKAQRLDELNRRFYNVFIALEEEVKNGRINSYGISSNSFSLLSNSNEFFSYEDLLFIAQKAASSINVDKHNFTTIELPINIIEQNGLKCAEWAKKNNLRVLSNRALIVVNNSEKYTLAEYDEPRDYFYTLNEILSLCEIDELESLYNLIEGLDVNRHKFETSNDYDAFLISQIIPHIRLVLEKIDPSMRELLSTSLNLFLLSLAKMVTYECSLKVKSRFKEEFSSCAESMQKCSVNFLKECGNIDYILLGMRRESYVADFSDDFL
ncbi:MAG: aldo/keto reductase [Helicobacteraceae bacterium]|nr:aldo/keto reductase [Helicobacteraceae bacterium]